GVAVSGASRPIVHRNARAFGGKSSGDTRANAARRAGDERNLVLETHVTPGDVRVRGGRFGMRISESPTVVILSEAKALPSLHRGSFGGCGGAPACNGVHAGGSLAGKLSCDASVTSSGTLALIPSRRVV